MKDALKDGTQIIARFKDYPIRLVTMWNGCQNQWVVAIPQVDFYHGRLDDQYFENEYFDDDQMIDWVPLPVIK